LKRVCERGKEVWERRSIEELSHEIGATWDLPIDITSKAGGLTTIARALNDCDIARAQIAAVLLAIPELPSRDNRASSQHALIKFVRELHDSNLINADWDSDEHPRWPAGAPDGQGGQFSPKGDGGTGSVWTTDAVLDGQQSQHDSAALIPIDVNARDDISRNPPGRKSRQECETQLAHDTYICGSLRDRREAAICHASAMQRYGACLAGKPLPPLTLPDPEHDFQPVPNNQPSHHFLSSPPRWAPLLFVPWWLWFLAPAGA
jgi:hypothetical protein